MCWKLGGAHRLTLLLFPAKPRFLIRKMGQQWREAASPGGERGRGALEGNLRRPAPSLREREGPLRGRQKRPPSPDGKL